MSPSVVNFAVIAVLLLPFVLASYFYYRALSEARPRLSGALREARKARFAFENGRRAGAVPDLARRHYLRAQIFGGIAFADVTVFLLARFAAGDLPAMEGLLLAGLNILALVVTARNWLRARRQGQAKVSPPGTTP